MLFPKEKALGERVFTGIPPRQWEKGNTLKEAHGGCSFVLFSYGETSQIMEKPREERDEREGVRPNYDRPGISQLLSNGITKGNMDLISNETNGEMSV